MTEHLLTTTVSLQRRVIHDGVTHSTLTMTEPTIGAQMDVWQAGMTQAEVELALMAALCGVPVAVIRKVSIPDYGQLQKVMGNFPYPPEEASGETSSGLPAPPAAGG
jgi:hypothetical protein